MTETSGAIHVLHVDDEPEFADLAATFLEGQQERISVSTAQDAESGLERLSNSDVDCVVSDYDMPGANGIEFLERVRQTHPDLPFILFTGKGSEEVASDAISAGVTDYLQKHGGTEQYTILANRIENAVARNRAQQEAEQTRTQLEAISENSADAILMVDADSQVHFANAAVERLFGYTPEELRGEPLTMLIPERFRDPHVSAIDRYLRTGERSLNWSNVEFPGLHKDGSEIPLSISFGEFWQDEEQRFIGILRDISDRTRMAQELRAGERELQETNALLETLFEGLPQGVLVEDESGQILTLNSQILDLFDITTGPDDFIGADSARLEDALRERVERPAHFGTQLDEVKRNRMPVDEEYLGLADGRLFIWTYRSLELPEGQGHLWIYRDVTERRDREQELRRNSRAMQEAPVGITITDPEEADNPIIYTNAAFHDLTGYAQDEVLGRNCRFLQGPETDSEPVTTMREAIAEEERVSVELRNYRKDGSEFWNRVTIAPVYDHVGHVTNYVGFQEDITERKGREHEREATIEFLQSLYDVATDATLTTDEKVERLLRVGPEKLGLPYGHLTRIEREGATGEDGTQTIIEASGDHDLLQPGESCPLRRSYCRRTIEQQDLFEVQDAIEAGWQGDPAYETFELGCYIGTKVTVNDELFGTVFFAAREPRDEPFTDAERTFIRLMSKLIGYELEREQVTQELERRNARLQEFASVVSHDLRNPLQVAQGRLELVESQAESEHIEAIEHAHDRIQTLTEELLSLAREGGAVSDEHEIDVRTLAQECWANVETVDATLRIEGDRTVEGNRSRLKQVFENIFRNAIEHAGPQAAVTVGAMPDGVYIEDDGPGIAPEARERVFELGYSTSSTGTGFGLSIVKDIVEAHGGTVTMAEGTEGGARFELTGL